MILRSHQISPTDQRVRIARELIARCTHLSADELYQAVNTDGRHVSKATVYNTLGLLVARGVVREVIADPHRVFYDPNTKPHHHFFDVATGKLIDIDASGVSVSGLPTPPEGTEVDGMEIVVRLRPSEHIRTRYLG